MDISAHTPLAKEEHALASNDSNTEPAAPIASSNLNSTGNLPPQMTMTSSMDITAALPSFKVSPRPTPPQGAVQLPFAPSVAARNPVTASVGLPSNGGSVNAPPQPGPNQAPVQSNPVNHKRLFGELSVNMRSFDSLSSPDPVYFPSPFFIDGISPGMPDMAAQMHQHMQMQAHHAQVQAAQNYEMILDGKAIVDDFLSLSSTGECGFETVSRKVHRRVWNLNEDQKRSFFESVANALLLNPDPEMASRVFTFSKGSMFIGPLASALIDAYNLIQRKADAVRKSAPQSTASPNFPNGTFTRSPWQTAPGNSLLGSAPPSLTNSASTAEGAELSKQHSLMLEDSRWIVSPSFGGEQAAHAFTPGIGTPGSTATSSGSSVPGQPPNAMDADGNGNTLSKHNARKKTISALNRMKQFVVPSDGNPLNGSDAAGSMMDSGDQDSSGPNTTANANAQAPDASTMKSQTANNSNGTNNPAVMPMSSAAFDLMAQNFATYGIRQAPTYPSPRSFGELYTYIFTFTYLLCKHKLTLLCLHHYCFSWRYDGHEPTTVFNAGPRVSLNLILKFV